MLCNMVPFYNLKALVSRVYIVDIYKKSQLVEKRLSVHGLFKSKRDTKMNAFWIKNIFGLANQSHFG